ncbi:MAG: alpha/beta hydrolase [Eubacterium sp.]|nr:alpha/beta hydrolase [Eubacterium sp.]
MKFTECGKTDGKTLVLLPGTGCSAAANFSTVLPHLEKEYHLILIDYDGFDGAGTVFSTMEEQAKKIEDHLLEQYEGKIDAVYGSSLGGSFAGLLLQRQRIHMDHVILGSSDLDQSSPIPAFFSSLLLVPSFTHILNSGKLPSWIECLYARKQGKEAAEKLSDIVRTLSEKGNRFTLHSMWNEFYSDLVTPLQERIDIPGVRVHIFYALGMGEKYRNRYLKHFANPDICANPYDHEMLLALHPQEWVQELNDCMKENRS